MSHLPKVYSTRKRRRDEEMERNLFRQNSEFQTKITDVNIDCLESIFMYLDFDDFINIAHTNKQLKLAADMAFARKFGKREVKLEIKSKYRKYSTVEINDDKITIYDYQTSLRLLRCFGHLFSVLHMGPTNTSRFQWTSAKIVGHANEYCSKSLVGIIFFNMPSGAFEHLKQPFLVATKVLFYYCTMDGKLKQLNKWFPKMQFVWLHHIETHLDYIDANSLHLRSLAITERRYHSSAESVTNAFRFNPSVIEYLYLDCNGWIRFLQEASNSLLRLYYLHIYCCATDFLGIDDHIFNFKNLNHLRMKYYGSTFQPIPRIPISFERLQEFTWGSYYNPLEDSVIEFFKKHPFITKLNLRHVPKSVPQNSEDIIAGSLPLLQEINFGRIWLSVDEVIAFINHAQLLKRMCFHMPDRTGFDRLKMLVNKEWQALIDGQRVEFKRED